MAWPLSLNGTSRFRVVLDNGHYRKLRHVDITSGGMDIKREDRGMYGLAPLEVPLEGMAGTSLGYTCSHQISPGRCVGKSMIFGLAPMKTKRRADLFGHTGLSRTQKRYPEPD